MLTNIHHKGILVVLSSPSGAGKTSLSQKLLEHHPNFSLSVSVTTRAPRPGEQEGREYYFRSIADFQQMIDQEAFLEYAQVFGHYYGTLRAPIEQDLMDQKDVLFDIDWQGTQQMHQSIPDDIVSIFILPPSLKALEERLRTRGQDSEAVIAERMAQANAEMSHWPEYGYVLINDDFERTLQQILSIVRAEKLKRRRQLGLEKFVKNLVGHDL